MKEIFLNILKVIYGSTGIVALIGYWPTIVDLYHHKKPSANISSYVLWTTTNGITFLYALCILPDPLLRMVTGVNFSACLTVLILSIHLKQRTKRHHSP